jgi:uncharacterized surface anchored protein
MPQMTLIKKDAVSGAVLPGATFRVAWNSGANYRDVTTDENGEAIITNLVPGWYTITETNAPEGYLLDSTPQQILMVEGRDEVVELFNERKPSLTILKVDDVTKTPLQYARFRIEQKTEHGVSLIGEYITDADGMVYLDNIIPGRYLITETAAPDGYNIDTGTHEVTIESGQAYQIEFTNTAQSPIYIQKVDDKGSPLMGAKFKVTTMNGAMVGTVTTGRTGYAIIPYAEPGWYVVEEVQAPDGYILSSTPMNIEVKSGKPAQVEFVNVQKPQLTILKLDAADNKALMGARIKVERANGELVGMWNERVKLDVQIKTNLKPKYRTVQRNLLSTVNNEIDCSRSALGLSSGEYVTEIKLVFGEVQPGFHETTGVKVQVKVLDTVENGIKFTNKVDVGGRYLSEWAYQTDGWTTVAYTRPRGDLPRTGR